VSDDNFLKMMSVKWYTEKLIVCKFDLILRQKVFGLKKEEIY
jgi:ribosomal protein L33